MYILWDFVLCNNVTDQYFTITFQTSLMALAPHKYEDMLSKYV